MKYVEIKHHNKWQFVYGKGKDVYYGGRYEFFAFGFIKIIENQKIGEIIRYKGFLVKLYNPMRIRNRLANFTI